VIMFKKRLVTQSHAPFPNEQCATSLGCVVDEAGVLEMAALRTVNVSSTSKASRICLKSASRHVQLASADLHGAATHHVFASIRQEVTRVNFDSPCPQVQSRHCIVHKLTLLHNQLASSYHDCCGWPCLTKIELSVAFSAIMANLQSSSKIAKSETGKRDERSASGHCKH